MGNAELRQKITQLRLSAHKLEIEVGRHKGVNRDERICMYCRMGKVESEEHFLFECPNYNENREDFRTQLSLYDQKFNRKMGEIELLKEIFESKDNHVFNLLGNFLHKSWKTRYLMASNFPKIPER